MRLLEQAIVEVLLLQSSDFAFMIHRGTTAEYATRRTAEHAANAHRLARMADLARRDSGVSPEDIRWADALRERTPFLRELPAKTLLGALA